MSFHDVRFPASLSFGSVGGPERRTEIVELMNGFEERNTPWSQSRRRYDAGLGLRSLDDVAALIAFFEARAGQMHAFRWKDWSDFKSSAPNSAVTPFDQTIGASDGARVTFALVKRYASGPSVHTRTIAKPVPGTVKVAIAGDTMQEGVDFTCDHATGLVTLTGAPESGASITAGYEFDVPVRFDTDRILVSVASFKAGQVPNVPVVEVRL